jgi:hypothetical protein
MRDVTGKVLIADYADGLTAEFTLDNLDDGREYQIKTEDGGGSWDIVEVGWVADEIVLTTVDISIGKLMRKYGIVQLVDASPV